MRALLLAVMLWAVACDMSAAPLTATCARIGDRCLLREGLQGVCAVTAQQTCTAPPCLACLPQH